MQVYRSSSKILAPLIFQRDIKFDFILQFWARIPILFNFYTSNLGTPKLATRGIMWMRTAWNHRARDLKLLIFLEAAVFLVTTTTTAKRTRPVFQFSKVL